MPVTTLSGLSSRSSDRLGWVDVTRGLLILFVIIFHVSSVHAPLITGDDGRRVLDAISTTIRPVRMPLFFVVSGLLAAGALQRSWPKLLRSKVVFFYWVYLTWLIIQTVLPVLLSRMLSLPLTTVEGHGPSARSMLIDLAQSSTVAPSNLWFLYALAIYFPLAKLVRPAGLWPLLPATALFLVSVDGWPIELGQLPAVAAYFAFFLAGSLLRPALEALASRPRPVITIASALILASLTIVELAYSTNLTPLLLARSIAAIVVGVAVAAAISRGLRTAARVLAFLGARTLPIYVLQMPLVWVWDRAVAAGHVDVMLNAPGVLLVYVLALSGAIAALATAIYAVLRGPLPLLFAPPRLLSGQRDRRPRHLKTRRERTKSAYRHITASSWRAPGLWNSEVEHPLRREATPKRVNQGEQVPLGALPAPHSVASKH